MDLQLLHHDLCFSYCIVSMLFSYEYILHCSCFTSSTHCNKQTVQEKNCQFLKLQSSLPSLTPFPPSAGRGLSIIVDSIMSFKVPCPSHVLQEYVHQSISPFGNMPQSTRLHIFPFKNRRLTPNTDSDRLAWHLFRASPSFQTTDVG